MNKFGFASTGRSLTGSCGGFSLVETMISIAMLGFLVMAVLAGLQWSMVAAVKSREELRGSRLSQMIHARTLTMDFYNVFSCSSAQNNFGLWAAFPERAVLQSIQDAVSAAGFTHFTIDVNFMRRDSADSNNNGLVSDLVAFTDNNGDLIDDFDPNIRYFDQNGDTDHYDTYMVGARKVAEQPDTHLKVLTIKIWKGNNTIAIKQGELLSAEQFSGVENPSSEASLQLNITLPENGAYLYRLLTATQSAANSLAIAKSYPSDVIAYRADATYPLTLAGNTEPQGTVNFYLSQPGGGVIDTAAVDMVGNFSSLSILVTNNLAEGANKLYGQTIKSTLSSPYSSKDYILDINPPTLNGETPSGTVKTMSPHIACTLTDTGVATTTVSGICEDVITFFNGSSTVPFRYDSATGKVVWKSTDTLLPPTLVDGSSYTVKVEGGDRAHYKTSKTWTFTVDIDDTDNSAPSVSNRSPLGANAPPLPVISCRLQDNQSGIIPASIEMKVDGLVVVSSVTTPVLGNYYDAETGTVSFTPSSPYASGTLHTVTIHAEHWAQDPVDPDKRFLDPLYDANATWTFTVQ